jgi:tripartite-type tricarboxylate transporter receptor subunit TctC
MLKRWTAALAACMAAAAAAPGAAEVPEACAPYFENQRFTLIIPNPPGGGFDAYGRAFAPVMEEVTGASVQVVNQPAGGGLIGVANVANAAPEDNVIGFFATNDFLGIALSPTRPEDVMPLGAIVVDNWVWITRPDMQLEDFIGKPITSGAPHIEAVLTRQILPARALGSEITVIAGYSGSAVSTPALLRGDVDLLHRSYPLALQLEQAGDARILFSLTEGPVVPGATLPHLAGEGGLVDLVTKDLPPEERARRMEEALLAAELNTHFRAVFVSSNVTGERLECLSAAVETALFQPALADAVAAIRRPYGPMKAEDARAFMARLAAAYARAEPVLEDLRNEALQ